MSALAFVQPAGFLDVPVSEPDDRGHAEPGGRGGRSSATMEDVDAPGDHVDPLELLSDWLGAARGAGEPMPDAMTLATVSADGWPSARMVMLRGLDTGVVFYTDRESTKGIDLAARPRAAVVLHWLRPASRQVRVVGTVEVVSEGLISEHWRLRRPQARWTAAAWAQSQVVASRADLEELLDDQRRRFPDPDTVPRPDRWSGFRIVPTMIEFWEEAVDQIHDRTRYRRIGAAWAVDRLSP
jgi:pyridoxamine 5'-phosphate oxidase